MKKITGAALVMILCIGILSGCSKKTDVENSTIFIGKKGNIVSVDVESLDKEYYDAKELETYITEHVTEYTDKNGDTIEKASFRIEEGIAKLQMKYNSFEDYARFNGIELYTGTIVAARAAGYDFDTEFISVKKEKEGESKAASPSKEEILAEDDNHVVIIKANIDVKVPGTVLYVSAKDTQVTGKDTVSITGEGAGEEAGLTYIIYK